jgi:quercetin dioxygenase-like cupin family protein
VALVVGIVVGVVGTRMLSAQQELAKGTGLQTAERIKGKGAMLVLRELPPGAETGKHRQSGNEIGYVSEVQGKPPVTLKVGDSFQTKPREVHNVKNASTTAPIKALVFYVTKKKDLPLSDISIPVE